MNRPRDVPANRPAVVRAIPVSASIPEQRFSGGSAVPPPSAAPSSLFWVPNLVSKERFEATAPEHFTCLLCGDPALPFTVLSPCGHATCQTCAEDSTRCPECERPILGRTVVRQLEGCVMSSLAFECKTRRCTFSSMDPHEAFRHVCDATGSTAARSASASTVAPQPASLPPSVLSPYEQLQEQQQRAASMLQSAPVQMHGRGGVGNGAATARQWAAADTPQQPSSYNNSYSTPSTLHRVQTQQQQQLPQQQQMSSSSEMPIFSNVQQAPQGNASFGGTNTSLLTRKTKQRKTLVFWDLESMQPSFYGMAPRFFFRKLLGCLVTSCGVSSEVQTLVYCPDDLDSMIADALADLGAFVRVYPTAGNGKDALEAAAVASFATDLRQLISSALKDNSISDTMFDVVVVTASIRFLSGARTMLSEVAHMQSNPFFMHVVSDMTALPMSKKMEVQQGAVTYVDVADFLRDPAQTGRSASEAYI